jgi:hypothetical protein
VKFGMYDSSPLVGEVRRGGSVSCVMCSASPSPSLSHLGRGGLWSKQLQLVFGDRFFDYGQDTLQIVSYFRIPEAQNAKALACKKRISNFVVRVVQVLASICFNNNFIFKANKIKNISTYRLLTTKLCSKVFAAQLFPENSLFWGHIPSKFSSDICQSHQFHYEVVVGI